VLGHAKPSPSASGRQTEGIGASLMEQKLEQKRITPRSPRAAL
jgi:hypothetical protein